MATPKTEAFKGMLQENVAEWMAMYVEYDEAGKPSISENAAMALYKIAMATPIQFLLTMYDHLGYRVPPTDPEELRKLQNILKLPIRGVAVCKITFSKPRLSGGRESLLKGTIPLVPHYRVKSSRKVIDFLVQRFWKRDPDRVRATARCNKSSQ